MSPVHLRLFFLVLLASNGFAMPLPITHRTGHMNNPEVEGTQAKVTEAPSINHTLKNLAMYCAIGAGVLLVIVCGCCCLLRHCFCKHRDKIQDDMEGYGQQKDEDDEDSDGDDYEDSDEDDYEDSDEDDYEDNDGDDYEDSDEDDYEGSVGDEDGDSDEDEDDK